MGCRERESPCRWRLLLKDARCLDLSKLSASIKCEVCISWAFEVRMQTCFFGLDRVGRQQITKHQLLKPQQVLELRRRTRRVASCNFSRMSIIDDRPNLEALESVSVSMGF